MKKKNDLAVSNNTKIAIIFFLFLAFIVGLSLTFKIIGIIRDGQFDSSKRFNLAISNGKNTDVMSFSNYKNIATLKLDRNINYRQAGRFLQVPIDGYIDSSILDLNQKANSLLLKSALNYQKLKTNLTIIDLLKLFVFTAGIKESNTTTRTISYKQEAAEIDKIIGRYVADTLIEKDNRTIQIINGTNIGGLGNRLARLVTNMGGDVIIVATSDVNRKKSIISYIDKKTYTIERLGEVLGYEIMKDVNAISDITIVIGEDKANDPPF